jgi:hypothetical protein
MCLPHSLEVSTRIIYAGGRTEEDDALLEETLCKTTNDHKSKKWRTMNYWEEKPWLLVTSEGLMPAAMRLPS